MTMNVSTQRIDELSLNAELQEQLIRLPYRIGLWLSQSDQTGGSESNILEQNALESVILSYGEDVCKSEFTQSVMEKTVLGYEQWDTWAEHIEDVPKECETLIFLLSSDVSTKHLNDFKESLFEIAETVALAYREIEEEDISFLDSLYIRIRILQKKWDAFIKKYDFSLDHVLNISPSEEDALRKLKGVLRI